MPNRMKEKFKTYGNVFDRFTLQTIERLRSKGVIDELKSPIFVGKESNVFTATSQGGTERLVVKIYRLESCDFKRMFEYLMHDYRYDRLPAKAGDFRRRVILSWVHREYRNLLRAREIGVRVPTPITYLNNVLVLEFIGNETPAPRLKDCHPPNPTLFFNHVMKYMKLLHRAGMVHGDLSPFNILNWNNKPVFIDFSQATILENPYATHYLERDCKNVCTFFSKLNVTCDPILLKNNLMS